MDIDAQRQVMDEAADVYISAQHSDVIHDVAFDLYGKRMATCASDHTVKIWDLDASGCWQVSASFKAHNGSVWKVAWAHPEFGQVLATCSFDRTVAIWEEQAGQGKKKGTSVWDPKRAELPDSRTPVTDVEFAPKHLGLKFAACSSEGVIRIYEAMDVMNLTSWSQMEDFKVKGKGRCTCLSWNPSRRHPAMIAVGCTGGDGSSNLQVWDMEDGKRWSLAFDGFGPLEEGVYDVAFAPSMGRSYHLLAAACCDNTVRIWKLTPKAAEAGSDAGARFEVSEMLQGAAEGERARRVAWNVTGTTLASSSDDGTVRLWRGNLYDSWECDHVISGHA